MTEIPHEHDDEGNCIPPENGFYAVGLPTWRFSPWDIVGITLTTAGGLFSVVGQGLNLAAREFAAAANYARQNYDLRQAAKAAEEQARSAAEELRALVEGPGDQA